MKKKFFLFILTVLAQTGLCRDEHLPPGFRDFSNIEQIVFCVPLPLDEYTEKDPPQRAWHVFASKKNPHDVLSIQGKFKSIPQQTLQDYVDIHYRINDVEKGKLILKRKMSQETSCYYETSCWRATAKYKRGAEMIWVRPDDVVVLTVDYPVSDTAVWNQRLDFLIRQDSNCR